MYESKEMVIIYDSFKKNVEIKLMQMAPLWPAPKEDRGATQHRVTDTYPFPP